MLLSNKMSLWKQSCCFSYLCKTNLIWIVVLWEKKVSCQDILRHDSPFRQGICQSSTALWDCWTQPWCLWSSNQRSLRFLSQSWHFHLMSKMIYWLSRPSILLYLSPYPQLGLFPLLPAVWSCPLPSPFPRFEWSTPQAPLSGPAAVVTPPHCVLPAASALTRCRLIASSRNPATFSPSSCSGHTTKDLFSKLHKTNCDEISTVSCCSTCWVIVTGLYGVMDWKQVYIDLVYEGVVNKFTGKVFGGVSWKFHMKYFSRKKMTKKWMWRLLHL